MDQKLASLIDRLEAVVKRAEASNQGSQQSNTSVVSTPGVQSATVNDWIKEVIPKVKPL